MDDSVSQGCHVKACSREEAYWTVKEDGGVVVLWVASKAQSVFTKSPAVDETGSIEATSAFLHIDNPHSTKLPVSDMRAKIIE